MPDTATKGATEDEIRRVHEWDCDHSGHSYQEIESFGMDGPVKVVCTHCGKSWGVVREDA